MSSFLVLPYEKDHPHNPLDSLQPTASNLTLSDESNTNSWRLSHQTGAIHYTAGRVSEAHAHPTGHSPKDSCRPAATDLHCAASWQEDADSASPQSQRHLQCCHQSVLPPCAAPTREAASSNRVQGDNCAQRNHGASIPKSPAKRGDNTAWPLLNPAEPNPISTGSRTSPEATATSVVKIHFGSSMCPGSTAA